MMPHKGASTQQHNQQVLAKPRHSPSNRDQQARQKLQQKAKIRSQAYIQLGEDTLKTVHGTFHPGVPVILHLLALTDGSLNLKENTTLTLFVIQEGLNYLEMTDYFFTNIELTNNKHTLNSQRKPRFICLCLSTGKYQS